MRWSSARPTTCWFSKDQVESEGPFGEYQGYMPASSADAVIALQKEGLPVIDGMLTMESALTWFVIRVSNDWHKKTGLSMEDFVKKIGNTLWTQHVGGICTKILVVNEDIDPDNVNDVTWAFATRNHPTRGTFVLDDLKQVGTGLEVYHSQSDFIHGSGLTVYSCLPLEEKTGQPLEGILSFEANYPGPIKKKVLDNWSKWGFEKVSLLESMQRLCPVDSGQRVSKSSGTELFIAKRW